LTFGESIEVKNYFTFFCVLIIQKFVSVASLEEGVPLNLVNHWAGYTSLVIFLLAYIVIIAEEKIHLMGNCLLGMTVAPNTGTVLGEG
jgi:hypothetical protein